MLSNFLPIPFKFIVFSVVISLFFQSGNCICTGPSTIFSFMISFISGCFSIPLISNLFCEDIIVLLSLNLLYITFVFFKTFFVTILISLSLIELSLISLSNIPLLFLLK